MTNVSEMTLRRERAELGLKLALQAREVLLMESRKIRGEWEQAKRTKAAVMKRAGWRTDTNSDRPRAIDVRCQGGCGLVEGCHYGGGLSPSLVV